MDEMLAAALADGDGDVIRDAAPDATGPSYLEPVVVLRGADHGDFSGFVGDAAGVASDLDEEVVTQRVDGSESGSVSELTSVIPLPADQVGERGAADQVEVREVDSEVRSSFVAGARPTSRTRRRDRVMAEQETSTLMDAGAGRVGVQARSDGVSTTGPVYVCQGSDLLQAEAAPMGTPASSVALYGPESAGQVSVARVDASASAPAPDQEVVGGSQRSDNHGLPPEDALVAPVEEQEGQEVSAFVRQVRDAELREAAPVLSPVHAVPNAGWRKVLTRVSFGRVQPPPSARQAEHDHEVYRVRTQLTGNRHIVVLAYGTGVGKTLTAGCVGLQFAVHRDDRVAVIDADQTAGNLADRFATPAGRYLQDLLSDDQDQPVDSIVELRRYARSAKRLDIYTADHDEAFTGGQHHDALGLLSRFHDIVITDLGSSGLRDMPEVLDTATDVVIVTGTSMDAVDRSRKVLDRLEELGHAQLARQAVVAVVTRTTKDGAVARATRNGGVHVETLLGHFQRRCRATVLVPYSARLADGVHVDHETLDAGVDEAYLRIAGHLGNGFRPLPERAALPGGATALQLPAVVSTENDPAVGEAPELRQASGEDSVGGGSGGHPVSDTESSMFAGLPRYHDN